MAHRHGQRRLLSATRLGVFLLGLVAAICLAIAAALVNPNWSPLLRSPLPDPSAASVGDRIVVRESPVPVQRPSEVESFSEDLPASVPTPEVERPSAPVSAPAVVVSTPTPPERGASAPGGGRPSPAPAASPTPTPTPAPPTAAESPPEAPLPPPPEAVISTHPGQGNAYGKGNGNGPPGGVPPGQVGR